MHGSLYSQTQNYDSLGLLEENWGIPAIKPISLELPPFLASMSITRQKLTFGWFHVQYYESKTQGPFKDELLPVCFLLDQGVIYH